MKITNTMLEQGYSNNEYKKVLFYLEVYKKLKEDLKKRDLLNTYMKELNEIEYNLLENSELNDEFIDSNKHNKYANQDRKNDYFQTEYKLTLLKGVTEVSTIVYFKYLYNNGIIPFYLINNPKAGKLYDKNIKCDADFAAVDKNNNILFYVEQKTFINKDDFNENKLELKEWQYINLKNQDKPVIVLHKLYNTDYSVKYNFFNFTKLLDRNIYTWFKHDVKMGVNYYPMVYTNVKPFGIECFYIKQTLIA